MLVVPSLLQQCLKRGVSSRLVVRSVDILGRFGNDRGSLVYMKVSTTFQDMNALHLIAQTAEPSAFSSRFIFPTEASTHP
jgi:hypothetical protein